MSLSNLYQLVFLRMEMNLDGTSEMKEMQLLNNHTDQLNALIKNFGVQITLLLRPLEPVSIDDFEKETMLLGLKRRSMTHYEKLGELVLDKNGKRQGNRKGTIELRWLDDRNIAISLNVPLIAPESDPLRLLMTAANAFAAVFDAKIVDQLKVTLFTRLKSSFMPMEQLRLILDANKLRQNILLCPPIVAPKA